MESAENCVENGGISLNGDAMEQQYEEGNDVGSTMEVDNNVFAFETHFNEKEMESCDEYDDDEMRSFKIR
jgi:hypothetical protein